MTLRQKILLLSMVAIFGMFISVWLQYKSYITQYQAIEVVARNVKAVGALSYATHELQKERGQWAIIDYKAGSQTLAEQIGHADAALYRLADTGAHIIGFNKSLASLRIAAAALSAEQSTEQLATLDGYNNLLQSLLDQMDRLTREPEASVAKTDIAAHSHLVAAKEYLGRMRATLCYWAKHKHSDFLVLHSLIRLKNLHDEELRKFGLEASPGLRETFAAKFSGQEVAQTLEIVTQITTTDKLPRGLDEQAWWSMATSAMDRLKVVEDRSLALIEQETESELAQIRSAMSIWVIVTLVASIAILILALSATTTLLRDLKRALASMEFIAASQDFNHRLQTDSPGEIGRISHSFNGLLDIAERLLKEKDYLAATDPLTGINNRLRFAKVLHEEADRKRRTRVPMSLIIFDIDHFKRINDTYGHNIGDEVLKTLTRFISGGIRDIDLFARWGGEEFVLLLKDNDCDEAMAVAEKLRMRISSIDFPTVGKVTCSFGVAAWKQDDTEASFVARADKALYASKKSGRNQVVCEQGANGNCRGKALCMADS